MAAQAAWPLISIVTPTFNRASMIGAAIESVLSQGYPKIEHIIVDAASTDGTAEVLARYPHLRVISEPDRGVYDGLNKGIRAARGEIIGHLNSDDIYLPNAFNAMARRFAETPDLDVVSGGATISTIDDAGRRSVVRRLDTPAHRALTYATGTADAPMSNARFFHRRIYESLGLYDADLALAADCDFLIRVALARPKTAEIDAVVYDYLSHPGSLTLRRGGELPIPSYFEALRVAERYMHDPSAPEELRARCKAMHRDMMRGACMALLGARKWRVFGQIFWRGVRSDAIWPMRFAGHATRRGLSSGVRRVRRRLS
jgi:glycosyltransferase involved in cell wall biosynthesis